MNNPRNCFNTTAICAVMALTLFANAIAQAQSMTPPRSSDMELITRDTAGRSFYLDKSSLAFDSDDTIYYWTKVVHPSDMMQIHGKPVVYSLQLNRQQCREELISDADLVYHYDGENNLLAQMDPTMGKGAKATMHKPEEDTVEAQIFTTLCKRQANAQHGEILSRFAAHGAASSKSPVQPREVAPGDFREELWTAAAKTVLGAITPKTPAISEPAPEKPTSESTNP